MAWVQIVNQIDQLTDDGRNGHSHQRAGNRHGFKNPVCRDLTANPCRINTCRGLFLPDTTL